MTDTAKLIDTVISAPVERRAAILEAARGAERPRMGTAKEAASILGVCTRSVERYALQGCFPRVHLSPRKVRYNLRAVEDFASRGRDGEQA